MRKKKSHSPQSPRRAQRKATERKTSVSAVFFSVLSVGSVVKQSCLGLSAQTVAGLGGKYLAMISAFGGLVISDTTTTSAAQMSVIGITGRKP